MEKATEQKLNFLIVDDILMNRMLLKEITKEFAGTLLEAENGKEAINILKDNKIDVILMDIEMPVMNGVETTRYIRKKLDFPKNETPIVAITAHNPDDFFEDYNNAGFNELLTKPYSFDKIIQILQKINV